MLHACTHALLIIWMTCATACVPSNTARPVAPPEQPDGGVPFLDRAREDLKRREEAREREERRDAFRNRNRNRR